MGAVDNIASLSEGQPSLSFMDARSKDAGRRLLKNYYERQSGVIAFIDESVRGIERPDEFPFYILGAVTIDPDKLQETRDTLIRTVKGNFWHTTEAYRNREYEEVRHLSEEISAGSVRCFASIQTDVAEHNLEFARRESLLQLCSTLLQHDCRLAIYEKRNTRALDSGDTSLLAHARRDGWLDSGLALVGSRPSIEPLLWAPDVLSWCLRQVITRSNRSWLVPFETKLTLVDASGKLPEKPKRPETAAARNSGPVLPADHNGDRASRSSIQSMPNYNQQLQEILHMLPNFIAPPLPPWELRSWLKQTFPK
jgi:hypothetical protein